jgi:uncharacterized membrane protein YkoI
MPPAPLRMPAGCRTRAMTRRQTASDIFKAELEDMADKLAYDLTILAPDGRLRGIRLNARSGAVLRIEKN